MNCPVCDRSLAPTLSICPSCGAMMFDSVREELQTKITSGRLAARPQVTAEPAMSVPAPKPMAAVPSVAAVAAPIRPMPTFSSTNTAAAVAVAPVPREKPVQTADLRAPKTSPTLVGFQSNNATLPDWRIKLQNAVKTRKGVADGVINGHVLPVADIERKPAVVPKAAAVATAPAKISDPRVAAAMRRIDESRNTFLEPPPKPVVKAQPVAAKPYKFDVVSTASNPSAATVRPKMMPPPALQVVQPAPPVKRDTNKLPPISMRSMPAEDKKGEVDTVVEESIHTTAPSEFLSVNRIRIKAEIENPEIDEPIRSEIEDIDDLAHFSTRFGAAFFDLIITSFASLLLLSPIALSRGEWFSLAGILTFVGVLAVLTFFYMTICLGFYGKTMGMRLFSLELVDAVENEYPTLHQAAVSSSVFLLSLLFGGAGFITMIFNEEKRAAHDLLSGTILVREF
jgi:uncharacterized RDD family membrane protein YckC